MFAAVCVLLAALGHVTMSGAGLPAWVLGAGFLVTGALGWALAGRRERGLPFVVTGVVGAQAALHSGFGAVQALVGDAAGAVTGAHMTADVGMADSVAMSAQPDMHMADATAASHAMHMADGAVVPHLMGLPMALPDASSYGMLLVHLLAALLCGLWLACGERAVFRVLRAVAARLAEPLRLALAVPVAPDRPGVPGRRRRSARVPRSLLLACSLTSRGPPPGAAAV